MAIKTTGRMWKNFYADKTAWPDGAYHDDTVIRVNGVHDQDASLDEVADTAVIEVETGYVQLTDGRDVDLVEYFTTWLKAQTVVCGAFEAPADKFEAIMAAIIAAGGTPLATE